MAEIETTSAPTAKTMAHLGHGNSTPSSSNTANPILLSNKMSFLLSFSCIYQKKVVSLHAFSWKHLIVNNKTTNKNGKKERRVR